MCVPVLETRRTVFDLRRFVATVPTSESDLRRLNYIHRNGEAPPRIAVLGKYNHGKSALLNALVGIDHFKVADKRQTLAISEYEHDGVVWVDTPGLDADPTESDDREARKAAFEIADFLFLVHQVTAGELDKYEISAYMQLANQDRNCRQKMALVLTKIDDADPAEVSKVENECRAQLQNNLELRELDIMSVSAVRYRNPDLRGQSGMDDVFAEVERLKADTAARRRREWSRLTDRVLIELREKRNDIQGEIREEKHRLDDIERRLESAATTLVGQLQGR